MPQAPSPAKSVIVIGAGASGLAGARALADAGCKVTVLEARSRIGGRIFTDRSLGIPFDQGASWIHGSRGSNPVAPIARSAAAQLATTDEESLIVFDRAGKEPSTKRLQAAINLVESVLADAQQNGRRGQSLEEFLAANHPKALEEGLFRLFLTIWVEFDVGGPSRLISSDVFDDDSSFPGPELILPDGYDAIPAKLAEGLDIRLNEPVSLIEHSESGVRVVHGTGELAADHCLCTFPLGVLKAGLVQFSPPASQRRTNAMARLEMGCVNKLMLVFEKPFWPTETHFIAVESDNPGAYSSFLNGQALLGKPALMTFALGEFAKESEGLDDAAKASLAMQNLSLAFGPDLPPPTAIASSRWAGDPWSQGAYSFPGIQASMADFDALGEPAGRLHFAGEHTISRYRATVHGAILSGRRAAEEIMKAV